MNLSFRELEVFRHVMEAGGVTAAAVRLRISQPAVSRMLRQTEARIGFPLFTRVRKRLLPTPEARALFAQTANAFTALDAVNRLAQVLREGRAGTLKVATVAALASGAVADAVQRFHADRPEVAVALHVVPAQEVVNLVADHQVDLGAIIGATGDASVRTIELGSRGLGCLLPRGHRLCAQGTVSLADLARESLICPGLQYQTGAQLSLAFEQAHLPFRIAIESALASVAGALVRRGAGVAVLDGFGLLAAGGADLEIRPLDLPVRNSAYLVEPGHRPISRLALEFRRCLREVVG
ncbi:LysR substrate-binding domain-containing protein [Roseomonas rosulenta]|uniref:LysR substrate-binding domain-containing protein n=1 Tax=Roseomonas rosulenta TaxID=2748667 RepID=UPI0018E03A85|nr:LysR substrate-binding domain-containing protein [Roseomonas rosulenta]